MVANHANKKKWVICFSSYWSDSAMYTTGQIMLQLRSDGYSILWVNSLPNRGVFSGKGKTGSGSKSSIIKRYWSKIKQALIPLRKKEDGFYLLTPIFLPWVENKSIIFINDILVKIQLSLAFLILRINDFIVASSSMMNIPYFFKNRNFNHYFHFAEDLYSAYNEGSLFIKEKMLKRENEIFNFTDKIFAVSQTIFKKIEMRGVDKNKIVYFPHGVEFEHFNAKKNIAPIMNTIPKPIVGYFGSLTKSNDQKAILKLAENGFSVVLIGSISGDFDACKNNSNIHFFGAIDYLKLPSYAQGFDVCMLNWEMTEWIKNCNPQKTYEYLAMGKPVISCRIPEIEYRLRNIVYFADNAEDYVTCAKKAIEENTELKQNERIMLAKTEDWSNKYSMIKNIFHL